MKRLFVVIAVLLLVGMPISAYAQEPAEGEITGKVINDTRGGSTLAGIEVTLITYINDAVAETRTTVTDGEGEFQFENVDMENVYLVSAEYMGVDYYYPVVFESGQTRTYVEVGVCDVTDSDSAVKITVAHTVIEFEEERLNVTEVYQLVNDSNMTYVGTDGALVFTLPERADGFEAPQELMIDYKLLEGNRVAYLVPFPPGERQLVYSYKLVRPEANEFTIPLKIDYNTDSLELMIAGDDIEVAVEDLTPAEPVITKTGERFIRFQGKDLQRNLIIYLNINKLSRSSGFPLIILWVIVAITVAGTAIYLISRRKRACNDE